MTRSNSSKSDNSNNYVYTPSGGIPPPKKVLNDDALAQDMKLINDVYVRTLKMGKKLYLGADGDATLKTAQELESYVGYLNHINEKISQILDLTDSFAEQCLEKANDIREQVDLEDEYKGDPSGMFMAYAKLDKTMSWADMSDKEDVKNGVMESVASVIEKTVTKKDYTHAPILYKNVSKIYGADLGFNFKVPIINKITEMPSSLYWYNGDGKYPPGIYICVTRGFYVQVPFPNVVDSTRDFNRTGSIKCKYANSTECNNIRSELARKYNSDVRPCNFAHTGDRYIKIGTSARCASSPRFGNHSFLKSDINEIGDSDINTILMYSLSDILLSSIWAQRRRKTSITTKIDIC
jgi:hypothetical protein